MDNKALEELNSQILGRVQHEIEHAMESPTHINRVIGEAMRHIGSFLEINSGSYLPVRPDEVLAAPVQMQPELTEAVLLLTRTVTSDNAFMVLANCKTVEDKRSFELIAYKQDNFNLNKTQFIKLPTEIGNEIIRQLNSLINNDGVILLQAVVVKNYFKIEEKPAEDGLFNSDVSAPTELPAVNTPPIPAPTMAKTTGGLPPVTDDALL